MTSPTLRFRMIWTVCHCLLSSLSPRFMYSSRGALGWGPRVITSLTYPSTNIKAITPGIPLLAPGRLKRTRTVNSYWYSGTSTLCYNSKKDVLVCRVNEAKPILKTLITIQATYASLMCNCKSHPNTSPSLFKYTDLSDVPRMEDFPRCQIPATQKPYRILTILKCYLYKEVLGRAVAHLPFPSWTVVRLRYVRRRPASPGGYTKYQWMSWWYFGTRVRGNPYHTRR